MPHNSLDWLHGGNMSPKIPEVTVPFRVEQPSVEDDEEEDEGDEKIRRLVNVMQFGSQSTNPMGVVGSALAGYGMGGGDWNGITQALKSLMGR